jgi:hypothetical protein
MKNLQDAFGKKIEAGDLAVLRFGQVIEIVPIRSQEYARSS